MCLFYRCDIYEPKSSSELQSLIAGFVRYVETLNKIRRTAKERRPKVKYKTNNDQGLVVLMLVRLTLQIQ